jgi:MoxR-like ATPase
VFKNLLLVDEINRATPKTQAALLEVMQERCVTTGGERHPLPEPFYVLATQNPMEMEGTYPLPEAQLDRFLMHVRVGYPGREAERDILRLARREAADRPGAPPAVLAQDAVFGARAEILSLHMAEPVEEYIIHLALATRANETLRQWLDYGASPRGTIALDRCARAHAWLHGSDFVSPDNVQAVVHDVLRHRLILNFDAEAAGMTTDAVIDELLNCIPVA